ncbi:O-methyltransferase [Novosphingobium sp. AP12]|uniref:O-methyltransferase n=1 Tax=Novosphingobium sp. AP12 TaxID=1144305 RepID=UPI000272107C|nr:O-methyltransferase [Novosphingobium sp. AP12]EJL22431.1 hypothetical protein PMI02_04663 [Novosphingobium sp. AP12]
MKPPSFTAINYSLRPSKTIQRGLVFDGLRRLQDKLQWRNAAYIGFGSIWFTDFILAHKILGIKRMVSIEQNLIGFRRARFNRPYRFVEVKRGTSDVVLPSLLGQARFVNTPTLLWLDYDCEVKESIVEELRAVVAEAKDDSVILVTVDTSEKRYGANPRQILERLAELFGSRSTRHLTRSDVAGLQLSTTIGELLLTLLDNASRRASKPNPSIRAFHLPYQDKASMVTIGSVFPHEALTKEIRQSMLRRDWPGFVTEPIVAPHLTSKEVAVLQAAVPGRGNLTRSDVRELGFDLEEEQLRAFEEHYRHYPTFAQILS